MSHSDIEPIPEGSRLETELKEARARAVDAVLEAERLEQEARQARRKATARLRAYDNLLLEHNGQLTLFEERGS